MGVCAVRGFARTRRVAARRGAVTCEVRLLRRGRSRVGFLCVVPAMREAASPLKSKKLPNPLPKHQHRTSAYPIDFLRATLALNGME